MRTCQTGDEDNTTRPHSLSCYPTKNDSKSNIN